MSLKTQKIEHVVIHYNGLFISPATGGKPIEAPPVCLLKIKMAICKNKTHQCRYYIPAHTKFELPPSCMNDGDIENPERDIYCGEIDGDDEKAWELRKSQ